jgi:Transposase IS66 family
MAHVRRYFYYARLADPERAHEALARIRALYAVEADAKEHQLAGLELAVYRQAHAGPVLGAFGAWLAEQAPRVLPKSAIGQAVTYATNQRPALQVYLRDGRLTIDNHPAELPLRPLGIGRNNWLHIAGDGGLQPAAVLLSLAASTKRRGFNPWDFFKHLFTELPARRPAGDLSRGLPDVQSPGTVRLCVRCVGHSSVRHPPVFGTHNTNWFGLDQAPIAPAGVERLLAAGEQFVKMTEQTTRLRGLPGRRPTKGT